MNKYKNKTEWGVYLPHSRQHFIQ